MTSREFNKWIIDRFYPKKCPFCGSENPYMRIIGGQDGFRDQYCVICDYDAGGCGAEGGLRHDPDEALDAWNQRRRVWRE